MATALRNTRFVKSAGPALQENHASRHHAPNLPSGKVSKGPVNARSTAARKLLRNLASAAGGQNAQLRGHWAEYLQRLRAIPRQLDAGPSDAAVEVVHATFTEALRAFTQVLTRDGGGSAH
jgi:hypothetical protein